MKRSRILRIEGFDQMHQTSSWIELSIKLKSCQMPIKLEYVRPASGTDIIKISRLNMTDVSTYSSYMQRKYKWYAGYSTSYTTWKQLNNLSQTDTNRNRPSENMSEIWTNIYDEYMQRLSSFLIGCNFLMT
jgi:hypothetical protein